ncbi:DegT/DnrJ/EryC1/StrS family aminotransferase [Sulfurospirillum arcachonense]|uniref:DegT/DnrJ/EryC1/StrS family aminotransferase n=1 Tax=Sulfurospirillum arcachonense TaxID=57666 RepID=UPI000468200C|nr:DegT/DnrJ/EryC1/StrS family aminotransferase [Sulfurospirillum arcachonense]
MKEIPFYKPLIDNTEKSLINEVLDFEDSSKIEELESNFSKYVGVKHSVSTCNGTAAMHLAMCALDLKRGDKIICSVNSFPAVAEVVRHFDAEPIFVDIDKDDFNMDVNELEKVLEKSNHKKLKAIFVSHVAGQIANLDRIYELANIYNVKVVEDATQALGGNYNNKKVGTTGSDITIFRFSPQMKNAIANAGIMTTNDDNLMQRARLLKNHAIVSDGWDRFGNLGYVYDVVDIGFKYDLNELNAAFAIGQLKKNDYSIKRRLEIATIYDKELKDCPHISLPVKKSNHTYDQYIIKVDKNRDGFAKELKENGIYTSLHFIPLHLLSYYKQKYNLRVNDFPNALTNYQQILSLPIYAGLNDKDVHYICEQIKQIAKNRV